MPVADRHRRPYQPAWQRFVRGLPTKKRTRMNLGKHGCVIRRIGSFLMRKPLFVLGLLVVGGAILSPIVPLAHAEEYHCPVLSIDSLVRWHGACLNSCHIVDKNPEKFKACQDKCNKDFGACDDRRKEIKKKYDGK